MRTLVVRDLTLRYKRSVLGLAWSLLLPLSQLVVFSFVFRRVVRIEVADYPAFIFSGLLGWTWFASSLTSAAGSITDNRELVRRPGFPVPLLPIIAVATNLLHFLLALPVLLLFVTVSVGWPSRDLVLLPAVIAVEFVLLVGLGYVLATVQVAFQDTRHLLGVILQLAFYLTPIFYDRSAVPARFAPLYRLNPMVPVVDGYRAVLLDQPNFPVLGLLATVLVSGGIVWFGVRVFRRAIDGFAEEV